MGPTNPLAQTNSVDTSVHHSTSLTNGDKPFNEVFNISDGYKTSCIDCWRLIKAYITEPKGVTKRGIKATIKATMARCCETIYKHSSEPKQATHFRYANMPLFGYFLKKLSHANFIIRDLVADTTSMTTKGRPSMMIAGTGTRLLTGRVYLTDDLCFISFDLL